MTNKSISLVGDSVLDNFYWLDDHTEDVRKQLSDLMPESTVYNFAVDESTINDITYGIIPKNYYQKARWKHFNGNYAYPTSSVDNKVYPLKLLKKTNPDYIIVSAGGNDGRVHLDKLLWGSAENMISAVLNDGLIHNFEMMFLNLKKTCKNGKMVFVLVYKPHETIFQKFRESIGWGLQFLPVENMFGFSEKLDCVYDHFRKVFIEKAKSYRIPIIDLSKTFNPKDDSHYGTTPIEPSNKSGLCISKLIKHVVENHNFKGESFVYYSPNCKGNVRKESI